MLLTDRLGERAGRAQLRLGSRTPPVPLHPRDSTEAHTASVLPERPALLLVGTDSWWFRLLARSLGMHPDLGVAPVTITDLAVDAWDEPAPAPPWLVERARQRGWRLHPDLATARLTWEGPVHMGRGDPVPSRRARLAPGQAPLRGGGSGQHRRRAGATYAGCPRHRVGARGGPGVGQRRLPLLLAAGGRPARSHDQDRCCRRHRDATLGGTLPRAGRRPTAPQPASREVLGRSLRTLSWRPAVSDRPCVAAARGRGGRGSSG